MDPFAESMRFTEQRDEYLGLVADEKAAIGDFRDAEREAEKIRHARDREEKHVELNKSLLVQLREKKQLEVPRPPARALQPCAPFSAPRPRPLTPRPPPHPTRTYRTSLVPPPVLTGHAPSAARPGRSRRPRRTLTARRRRRGTARRGPSTALKLGRKLERAFDQDL